jgi:hypothetical protein
MLAILSQKRDLPQKHARRRLAEEEEEEKEREDVSERTMSHHFRRSPDVSCSESPLRRSAPVVVDLTTTLEGRTLVIGPEDSLLCGPCKDNGINSHGARHLTRCEHMLAATVVNRRVKLVAQSLKDNCSWSAAVKRGLELPATPHPDVVKQIKALGDTDKKLLNLGPVGSATLQKIVDDSLTNYWSSLGLPVEPLVAKGLPAFVAEATKAPVKVKIEKSAGRYGSPGRGHYDSRGRSRRSSGGRRRHHRRDWSASSESSFDSRGRSDRKRYKEDHAGPGGPSDGRKDSSDVGAAAAAGTAAAAKLIEENRVTEAERVAAVAEADRVAAVAEVERLAAVAEVARVAAVAEAERVSAVAEVDRVAAVAETERLAAVAETERVAAVAEADRVAAAAEAERAAAVAEAERLAAVAVLPRVRRGPNGRWLSAP